MTRGAVTIGSGRAAMRVVFIAAAQGWQHANIAPMDDEPTVEEAVRSVLASGKANADDEQERRADASWRIIRDAAIEDPAALAPHLRALFPLLDRARYISEAWRAADAETVAFLFSVLDRKDERKRTAAKNALVDTGRRDVIERLLAHPHGGSVRLKGVGLEKTPDGLRALDSETPLHLAFSPETVSAIHGRFRWFTEDPDATPHPTWHGFDPAAPSHRFGGAGQTPCERCREPIDHLLTLDPVPRSLGVSLSRLTIDACLSCIFEQNGDGGAFFRHDPDGRPSALDDAGDGDPISPEFPSQPFAETGVCLVDLGPRWQLQPWGAARGLPNLNRVGGPPSWVQDAGYEKCPSCASTMTFLMQLDSGLVTSDGGNYDWANGGVLFVCWCDRCRISHLQIQNT
jgi:hypothetical protein